MNMLISQIFKNTKICCEILTLKKLKFNVSNIGKCLVIAQTYGNTVLFVVKASFWELFRTNLWKLNFLRNKKVSVLLFELLLGLGVHDFLGFENLVASIIKNVTLTLRS